MTVYYDILGWLHIDTPEGGYLFPPAPKGYYDEIIEILKEHLGLK